jgi:hypothetical protein
VGGEEVGEAVAQTVAPVLVLVLVFVRVRVFVVVAAHVLPLPCARWWTYRVHGAIMCV